MAEVFVFGSNRAGRHGKGAALYAMRKYGAVYGVGEGRTGDAYAIPTKDANLNTLPLEEIRDSVQRFVEYARANHDTRFLLTPIGTGLAGYGTITIVARVFQQCDPLPPNVLLTPSWVNDAL